MSRELPMCILCWPDSLSNPNRYGSKNNAKTNSSNNNDEIWLIGWNPRAFVVSVVDAIEAPTITEANAQLERIEECVALLHEKQQQKPRTTTTTFDDDDDDDNDLHAVSSSSSSCSGVGTVIPRGIRIIGRIVNANVIINPGAASTYSSLAATPPSGESDIDNGSRMMRQKADIWLEIIASPHSTDVEKNHHKARYYYPTLRDLYCCGYKYTPQLHVFHFDANYCAYRSTPMALSVHSKLQLQGVKRVLEKEVQPVVSSLVSATITANNGSSDGRYPSDGEETADVSSRVSLLEGTLFPSHCRNLFRRKSCISTWLYKQQASQSPSAMTMGGGENYSFNNNSGVETPSASTNPAALRNATTTPLASVSSGEQGGSFSVMNNSSMDTQPPPQGAGHNNFNVNDSMVSNDSMGGGGNEHHYRSSTNPHGSLDGSAEKKTPPSRHRSGGRDNSPTSHSQSKEHQQQLGNATNSSSLHPLFSMDPAVISYFSSEKTQPPRLEYPTEENSTELCDVFCCINAGYCIRQRDAETGLFQSLLKWKKNKAERNPKSSQNEQEKEKETDASGEENKEKTKCKGENDRNTTGTREKEERRQKKRKGRGGFFSNLSQLFWRVLLFSLLQLLSVVSFLGEYSYAVRLTEYQLRELVNFCGLVSGRSLSCGLHPLIPHTWTCGCNQVQRRTCLANFVVRFFINWILGLSCLFLLGLYREELLGMIRHLGWWGVYRSHVGYVEWFLGWPAGLKMNDGLNHLLGSLCTFILESWKDLISFNLDWDWLLAAYNFTQYSSGFLGLTFVVGFIADCCNAATLHLRGMFHGLSIIYVLFRKTLSSLLLQFTGKKHNPLRGREDEADYSYDEMVLGTLAVTLVIFLLPTVAVYYFYFALVRTSVWVVQEALTSFAIIFINFPLYTVGLWGFDKLNKNNNSSLSSLSVMQFGEVSVRLPSFADSALESSLVTPVSPTSAAAPKPPMVDVQLKVCSLPLASVFADWVVVCYIVLAPFHPGKIFAFISSGVASCKPNVHSKQRLFPHLAADPISPPVTIF